MAVVMSCFPSETYFLFIKQSGLNVGKATRFVTRLGFSQSPTSRSPVSWLVRSVLVLLVMGKMSRSIYTARDLTQAVSVVVSGSSLMLSLCCSAFFGW